MGLSELHKAGIVHRALDLDAVFVLTRGGENQFRIGRFDYAVQLKPNQSAQQKLGSNGSGKEQERKINYAPEIQAGLPTDFSADVWGLG